MKIYLLFVVIGCTIICLDAADNVTSTAAEVNKVDAKRETPTAASTVNGNKAETPVKRAALTKKAIPGKKAAIKRSPGAVKGAKVGARKTLKRSPKLASNSTTNGTIPTSPIKVNEKREAIPAAIAASVSPSSGANIPVKTEEKRELVDAPTAAIPIAASVATPSESSNAASVANPSESSNAASIATPSESSNAASVANPSESSNAASVATSSESSNAARAASISSTDAEVPNGEKKTHTVEEGEAIIEKIYQEEQDMKLLLHKIAREEKQMEKMIHKLEKMEGHNRHHREE